MNQLDPKNFTSEPDPQTWPPEEDYNVENDYSFGMKHVLKIVAIAVSTMLAAGLITLLFIAYFGVPN